MSPCGGECRVGRTLLRGGPSSPAHAGAGARRRSSAPPASPVRHQQTIATNKRSTSAAARRPPAAPQSAAQAAGAARAPRRSISHAHRSPRPRAPQSERCHKPPQRSCLNRGAVAHHPLARAASAAPLARAREELAPAGKRGAFSAGRSVPPGATTIRGASETKRSQRPPSWDDTDVAVWRRVSCWSHAAARWPVVASARRRRRAAPILGAASIARLPPTNDRRRPPRGGRPLPHRAPHRRLAQLAHPAGRSRMPIALHGLALRKASDAISPLNAVVEPGCCRTPPPSSRRQRRAPRARAEDSAREG